MALQSSGSGVAVMMGEEEYSLVLVHGALALVGIALPPSKNRSDGVKEPARMGRDPEAPKNQEL